MTDIHARSLAAKLRNLTTELRALDMDLKSGQPATGPLLREFRQALDNVRMTSWTVNELMDARRTSKDPQAVLSFLTAERLRRFSQLVKDLCGDIDHEGVIWQTHGIQGLSDSLKLLQERLGKLVAERPTEPSPSKRRE